MIPDSKSIRFRDELRAFCGTKWKSCRCKFRKISRKTRGRGEERFLGEEEKSRESQAILRRCGNATVLGPVTPFRLHASTHGRSIKNFSRGK